MDHPNKQAFDNAKLIKQWRKLEIYTKRKMLIIGVSMCLSAEIFNLFQIKDFYTMTVLVLALRIIVLILGSILSYQIYK